ncbi:hypothetical protein E5D57_012305 [Metarhizium anisopliae]|nr:hypothetical protein E5D57_012305 [Metarhizium anisopliae]
MLSFTPVSVLALAAVSTALPTQTVDEFAVADRYVFYRGSGANWPSQKSWGSFDSLWNANVPLMQKSCGWNGWGADNSGAEINDIKNAIHQVSGSTGVDKRFILAIMMQESKGCVRVPTTNNGVRNPGLMQSHNGSGSCAGVNPCPSGTIGQMIRDGVAGTSSGDGLKQTLGKAKGAVGDNSRAYYAAARMYNSGSVDYNNLDNGLGSTPCYATDVANRLTGWTLATSQCRA